MASKLLAQAALLSSQPVAKVYFDPEISRRLILSHISNISNISIKATVGAPILVFFQPVRPWSS